MIIITPTAQAAAAQASDASQGEELRRANAEGLKGERAAQINSLAITTPMRQHLSKMSNNQQHYQSRVAEYKGIDNHPHLLMRPKPNIVPTQGQSTREKENVIPTTCDIRPKFRIRPGRSPYHRPRHHNPGTRYRPDPRLHRHPDRRIKVISSKVVVPSSETANSTPTTSQKNIVRPVYRRPRIGEVESHWRQPKLLNLSPVPSVWKEERALVPTPAIDYRHGFAIYPGEAYQPVVWYEDRGASWPPAKIDLPRIDRPHMHDALGQDPRSQDLRILLEKLRIRDLRDKLNSKRTETFSTPGETPEQAIARIHGEVPFPTEDTNPTTEQSHESRPPTWPNHTDHPPTWPGPIRRRRRCRLVIIEEPR